MPTVTATSGVQNWDWKNGHVSDAYQGNRQLAAGAKNLSVANFIDSSTTLLVAGPACLADAQKAGLLSGAHNGIQLVPIGIAMGINLSMQRQSSRIYEIGSRLGYIIPGKVAGGLSISRALIDGGNLLKLMYAGEVLSDRQDGPDDVTGQGMKKVKFATGNQVEQRVTAIGSGPVALNLDSAFFNHPFGLGLIFRNQNDDTVSQHYFEGCVFTSYSLGISADQNVLTEGVSIEFVRCVPILTTLGQTGAIGSTGDGSINELVDMPISTGDTSPTP